MINVAWSHDRLGSCPHHRGIARIAYKGIYYLTHFCSHQSNVFILCELLILTSHFLHLNIYKARFFSHFFSGPFTCWSYVEFGFHKL